MNKMLEGHCCGKPGRVVEMSRAIALADKYGVHYVECDAGDGTNIEEAVMSLAIQIKERIVDGKKCDRRLECSGDIYLPV